MKKSISRYSFLAFLICVSFITVFRLSNVSEKETSWDVLGYYLPFPAIFIYDDPLMENREWIEKINEEKDLTGTLYQVSSNDQGEPIYFFLLGMAMLFLPFFLMGHGYAYIFDYPLDGFSMPYQVAMVIGGVVYSIIGLLYFRKILLYYLPDKISAIVLLAVVFGTNYSHHLTLKNLETINLLFLFIVLIIWNTIRWHDSFKLKNLIAIGVSITLASLVKPSEILLVLIPLFWGVFSLKSAQSKLRLLLKFKTQFVIAFGLCLLIGLPQMSYWYVRTGHLFYDSYKNPGVGLDVLSPHVFNSLFSYKKGWLIYTPILILGLLGFYSLFKKHKKISFSLSLYFLVAFYIISSWSEWWYGAGFSNRPMIITYPIVGLTLGVLLLELQSKKRFLKVIVGVFMVLCVFLNQFQWWQLRNGILDTYRTTKEYYWATFLKLEVTQEDKELLLVYRDFDGEYEFKERDKYEKSHEFVENFENSEDNSIRIEYGNKCSRLSKDKEYSYTFQKPFNELTTKDHFWVKVSVDVRANDNSVFKNTYVVLSMDRKEGAYGYYATPINEEIKNGYWHKISRYYLTPNVREVKDEFKAFVWNSGRNEIDLDNFTVEIFERK